MDLGLVVGFVAALAVLYHAFGGSATLIDPTGLLVCVGGALASTIVAFPIRDVLGMSRVKHIAFLRRRQDPQALIKRLVAFAHTARREGILALEQALTDDDDPWIQAGTRLSVDGTEPALIMDILETELQFIGQRHQHNQQIIDFYARALVIFGGAGSLIAIGMHASDITAALPAIVSPLLFGLLMAGLGAWPLKRKLAQLDEHETLCKRIGIEGVMAIQAGDNPRIVEHKLSVFLAPKFRPSGDEIKPALPPRPPFDAADESGAREISDYLSGSGDLILRYAQEAAQAEEVDEEERARIAALIERTRGGELSPFAMLSRLAPDLYGKVLHGLGQGPPPQREPTDDSDAEEGHDFEALVDLTDREVQALLREVDQRDFVIAFRGASPALRDKYLGNMSQRVRTFILEEMAYAPLRPTDVVDAQVRIVRQTRALRREGRIG